MPAGPVSQATEDAAPSQPLERVASSGSQQPSGQRNSTEERKAAKRARNKKQHEMKRQVSWKDDKTNNDNLAEVKEYRVSSDGHSEPEPVDPHSACCTIS